jgi:hypothetical protein
VDRKERKGMKTTREKRRGD